MIMVLYEDQLAAGTLPKQYGPHLLVKQCVADMLGREGYWEVGDVEALPCKGRDQLLRKLREGRQYAAASVVAVLDDDKVRDAHAALEGACKADVVRWLRESTGCPSPARLRPVLLAENMETLVDAVCTCLGLPIPQAKPRPIDRDELISRALARSAAGRTPSSAA